MQKRFDKLEEKVEEVKDDINELKVEFRVHTELMREHVAGDSKIIQQITPLLDALPDLKDIVTEYHLDKREAKKKAQERTVILDKIKIVSGILGIIGMISAYFLS